MPFGWKGQILDVDLTTGEVSTRDTVAVSREYLGGRILASRIAWDEIPAGCDAYDAENRIIIATGPLTGTLAPTTGRTIMASISPRTYPSPWYTHSTLGGWFGPGLKYAGYDAVVISGEADSPVYLDVHDGQPQLRDASALWGLGAREAQLRLRAELGDHAEILAIGQAGENRVRLATVQHAEENAAAHSGFGAVWGAKKLKAIVVRGSGGVSVADGDALLSEVLQFGKHRLTHSYASITDDEQQTPRPTCSQACTFNCRDGAYALSEDGRRVPGHCVGQIYLEAMYMDGSAYQGGDIEIPPSPNFALPAEVRMHELCNDLGVDLWFRLVMQPWFLRCVELGVHQIRGFPLAADDPRWLADFVQQIAHRQGLGAIFADDLCRAMDELEGELPEELIRLGRELAFDFGFPAHREGRFWDEEPLPFWVVSAMMHVSESRDPTIGGHQSFLLLANLILEDPDRAIPRLRAVAQKVWGDRDAFEPTFENKAPVAIWSQHQHMLVDSLPLCDFAFPQVVRSMRSRQEWQATEDIAGDLDIGRRLLNAVTGERFTQQDLDRTAERGFTLERALLARGGRYRAMEEALAPHFQLPCRADGTCIDAAGFSKLLDEYYVARGWDLDLGWPTPETLQTLGLDKVIPELGQLRALHASKIERRRA
jgi:aldehyde:ferredoxin oxidoreductase